VPAYSAACAFGVLAYLLFTTFTAANCRGRDILLILCYGLAAYLAAGWIWAAVIPERAFLAPHEGDEGYRLLGLSSHPNMLAVEAACLLCVLIPAAVRGFLDRRLAGALGLLGVLTILAAGSRTTAVAVAISAGAVWLRQRRATAVILVLPVACIAGLTLVFGLGLAPRFDEILGSVSRSGDASEILTLTGRTELWAFVWNKFTDRPLFGYGFNSAEAVLSRDWYGNADAGYNAHNVILQALLTTGIAGTIPLLVAITVLTYRWFTVRGQSLSSYLIPYVLILGATEAHIAAMPTLLTLLLFLSIAMDIAERQALANARGSDGRR
jgi:O-antigen ligase